MFFPTLFSDPYPRPSDPLTLTPDPLTRVLATPVEGHFYGTERTVNRGCGIERCVAYHQKCVTTEKIIDRMDNLY